MIANFFFNGYPLWEVPNAWSWQHVTLLLISAAYITALALFTKNRSKKTQELTFKILSIMCGLIFIGRLFFGWRNIFNWNTTQYDVHTLFPFELCNIGIFILIAAVYTKKRFLFTYAFFMNFLGALFAFVFFPPSHMIPKNTLLHYMFFDYYIIHTHLVALPVAFIACKWYKPKLRDALSASVMFFITASILLIICLIFDALKIPFENGARANYMYVTYHNDLPILKQLYNLIPVPLLYMVPLLPLFFGYCLAFAFPFSKKGERLSEFTAMKNDTKAFFIKFKSLFKAKTKPVEQEELSTAGTNTEPEPKE